MKIFKGTFDKNILDLLLSKFFQEVQPVLQETQTLDITEVELDHQGGLFHIEADIIEEKLNG